LGTGRASSGQAFRTVTHGQPTVFRDWFAENAPAAKRLSASSKRNHPKNLTPEIAGEKRMQKRLRKGAPFRKSCGGARTDQRGQKNAKSTKPEAQNG